MALATTVLRYVDENTRNLELEFLLNHKTHLSANPTGRSIVLSTAFQTTEPIC